ncbi:MAG: hypothetical protein CM15mP74_24870 [Halieaceae bacterium]|nr:MAG: hypothetical protein CM15mP74_24870 [Halieaceae bacterium]
MVEARYDASSLFPDDDIESVAAALQSRGAVVIDELLPDNIVADLSADLRPEFDREGHLYQNAFNGHQTLRGGSPSIPRTSPLCSCTPACWPSLT